MFDFKVKFIIERTYFSINLCRDIAFVSEQQIKDHELYPEEHQAKPVADYRINNSVLFVDT